MKETSLFIKIIVCVFAAVLVVGLLVALTKGANDNTGSWFDEIVEFFGGGSSNSGGGGGSADKDESATETVERFEGDAACAHTFDKGVVDKAATCKEEGLIVYTCTKCGKTQEDTLEISTEHTYGSPKKYDDAQHVLNCTVCGLAQYADHALVESTIAATCTTNGAIVYDCACGYQSRTTIEKLGHNVTSWNKVSGDSTNHHGVCVREGCGAKISKAHTYGAEVIVIEATCTASGLKTKTCTTCGYVHNITIPASGHDLETEIVSSTCAVTGTKTVTCNNCEYSNVETLPKKSSHTFGQYECLPLASDEIGDLHYKVCSVCGIKETEPHSWTWNDTNEYCKKCNWAP